MSVLTSLQQQCADRLQADRLFAHVPVLTERIHDLQSEINTALGPLTGSGGRSGLVAIVRTPSANVNFGEVFGPFFDEIRITVRVVENVLQNQDGATGTGISAATLAEQICSLLHHFQPDSANGPVLAQRPTISLVSDETNLIYQCHFRTSGGLRAIPEQLAAPVINNSDGAISLASPTPGAAVFYTMDGGNPSPLSGVLYSTPFAAGAGIQVKARAWLAGYVSSEISSIST